jgi:hypothetical protein
MRTIYINFLDFSDHILQQYTIHISKIGEGGCPEKIPVGLGTNCISARRNRWPILNQDLVKYSVSGAGGQDQLKGNIFRIITIGYTNKHDVITGISDF